MRVNSNDRPTKFSYNVIGNKVEIYLHENIEEINKEGEISFDSDMTFNVVNNSRDDIIAGFIHLKYSVDKEIALFHKGNTDPTNPEYIEYLEYRQAAKEYVGK